MKKLMALISLLMLTLSFSMTANAGRLLNDMNTAIGKLKSHQGSEVSGDLLAFVDSALYGAVNSPRDEAKKPSSEFLDALFELTYEYDKKDASGAAVEMFSAYYSDHPKEINGYIKNKKYKISQEKINHVMTRTKEYGTATDPGPKPNSTGASR